MTIYGQIVWLFTGKLFGRGLQPGRYFYIGYYYSRGELLFTGKLFGRELQPGRYVYVYEIIISIENIICIGVACNQVATGHE